jgi:lipoate-protein ligase A
MVTDKITLIRRNSGGGAVYHDYGNSNYCIMVPREEFKRETNSQLVSDTLNKLGCPTYLTPRNDIAVNGSKISGSAYKIAGEKAYHHGTMLLGSDLSKLMKYLTTNRVI